jgi:phage terminase large subunit
MHHTSNLTAPRVNDQLLAIAGRGGGKTKEGALAVREELMAPNALVWVMSENYKFLHDSTFPTLVRLIDPSWVKRWDPGHVEIHLTNGAKVAFRSLEDPERARGPHGVTCGWFDEAAKVRSV